MRIGRFGATWAFLSANNSRQVKRNMMASNSNDNSPQGTGGERKPLTPQHRKRLQQCFEVASKNSAGGSFDYATDLLTTCVLGDPGNSIYLQTFLGNLQKKYNDNKKGSKLAGFRTASSKAMLKKSKMQKHWTSIVKTGLEILKVNPWDVPTLLDLAAATDALGYDEIPLIYLRLALEVNPKNPDVNRAAGYTLAARGQFDQAIACWGRVKQAVPDDKEAIKALADLAVEKTIDHGRYEGAESSREVSVESNPTGGRPKGGSQAATPGRGLTPIDRLKKEIAKDPSNMKLYLDLAEEHFHDEDYPSAEEVLREAYEASDHDDDIREKYEDAQLRHLRSKIAVAQKAYRAEPTTENKRTYALLRKEFFEMERDIYKNRCERYPHNLGYKYELGARYQQCKQFNEAIQQFQAAQNDVRRKSMCLLRLGQCFEQIKQPRLATQHFDRAVKELSDRDEATRKEALLALGRILVETGDLDAAEKHLNDLAAIDFGYKDVAALLDKINDLRNNS